MKKLYFLGSLVCLIVLNNKECYAISSKLDSLKIPNSHFVSLSGGTQNSLLHLPTGFSFQRIAQRDDPMSDGNTFPANFDFTGYVPIAGSSENGYLSINAETVPGGVSMMDIAFNSTTKRWSMNNSKKVDFTGIVGTAANCSGTVTPWNTIITCEEVVYTTDVNADGYYDLGWAIEINPVTKTVINNQKLWALGNFNHENICIHTNQRTAYQGIDNSTGYLYKFVADTPQNLSQGKLYVYVGSKNGTGTWELLNNSTPTERNTVVSQSTAKNATVFSGIEDVEINPINGWVYLAVKNESVVYRFQDSDPLTGTTVVQFETFVGGAGASYNLATQGGNVNVPWGTGNDNLAFDSDGNLWVLQDGSDNHIWVVGKNHTLSNPDVRIFMRTPAGSEPTGITFSPDNRFIFLSIQHPSGANNSTTQPDVNNTACAFDKDAAIVIARDEHWGKLPCQNGLNVASISTSGYFQSNTNLSSTAVINPSEIVGFTAQNYIELQPGFTIEKGGVFRAKIRECQ